MYEKRFTVSAEITIGYNKGYNYLNSKMSTTVFSNIINEIEDEALDIESISEYISFVIIPAKCLYKKEWGCPTGGENIFVLRAIANRRFIKDVDAWKMDVLYITSRLKKRLQQSTVTVSFTNAEMYYDG